MRRGVGPLQLSEGRRWLLSLLTAELRQVLVGAMAGQRAQLLVLASPFVLDVVIASHPVDI